MILLIELITVVEEDRVEEDICWWCTLTHTFNVETVRQLSNVNMNTAVNTVMK